MKLLWTKNQGSILLCERNLIRNVQVLQRKKLTKKTHPYSCMESRDGFWCGYANSKCTSHNIPWEGGVTYMTIVFISFGTTCFSFVFDPFHAFHARFLWKTILKQNSKFFFRKIKRLSKEKKIIEPFLND
jgi:hypothetical protein